MTSPSRTCGCSWSPTPPTPTRGSWRSTALTRLDHNRAVGQVALRAKVPVSDVRNVIIWGNHSSTQYPDVNHASVRGKPAREVLRDDAYLDGPFVSEIQQRGKAVINPRGASSALSAAHSACDHVRDWVLGTPSGAFVSMAVMSKGEYGVPAGIVYSFPVKCKNGEWEIVQGLDIDARSRGLMDATAQELVEEQGEAKAALGM